MEKEIKVDLDEFRSKELPKEAEIMSSWQGDVERPVVSILCHSYNHRPYIEDALRGFLIQSTTFPFEIILHDDASTDGTSDIIRSYANRYPRIIKPVVQSENQYSKGIKPTLLSFPHAKGQFIAMCEGDDFWFSPSKLKTQFELAADNPEHLIFFHPAILLSDNKQRNIINCYGLKCRVFKTDFLIRGGGGVMPTASLMIHRSVFECLPLWFRQAPVGDYYLQVIGSRKGAFYSPDPYSVYRSGTAYSVSEENRRKKGKSLKEFYMREITTLDFLNEFFERKYSDDINFYKSIVAQNCAIQSLSLRDFDEFLEYIAESWSFHKHRARSQAILILLRRNPKLAWGLVCCRRFIFGKG